MSEDLQESLDKLPETHQAEAVLMKAFFARARACAASMLSQSMQTRVRPTEIANAAIYSSIKKAKMAAVPINLDEFEKAVVQSAFNKARKRVEYELADKRTPKREVSSETVIPDPWREHDPVEILAIKEIADEITRTILEEPDNTKMLIRYLGIIDQHTGEEIFQVLTALAKSDPKAMKQVPKVRAIQVEIAETKKSLAEKYGADQ